MQEEPMDEEDALMREFQLRSRPLPGALLLSMLMRARGIDESKFCPRNSHNYTDIDMNTAVNVNEFIEYVTVKLYIVDAALSTMPPRMDHAFRLCQNILENDVPQINRLGGGV
jgi:hypothetical protein